MSLAAIVLSALFQFVAHLAKTQAHLTKTEESILQEETAIARFNQLLHSDLKQLFTAENSLLFCSKQPLDPDPAFNSHCWSYIRFHEKNLELHRYSLNRDKSRSEILFKGIDGVEWEFRDDSKWVKQWPKKFEKLPSMIRLKISKSDEKKEYAFLLNLTHPIQIQRAT